MQKFLLVVAVVGLGYFQFRKVFKRGGDVDSALQFEVCARHPRIIGVASYLPSFSR